MIDQQKRKIGEQESQKESLKNGIVEAWNSAMDGNYDIAHAIIKNLPINDWTSSIIEWLKVIQAWIQENPKKIILIVIATIILIASGAGIVTKSLQDFCYGLNDFISDKWGEIKILGQKFKKSLHYLFTTGVKKLANTN